MIKDEATSYPTSSWWVPLTSFSPSQTNKRKANCWNAQDFGGVTSNNHCNSYKSKRRPKVESFKRKMPGLGIFPMGGCFDGCRDHTQASGFGTRVWNLSDRPVELQVRLGSILKKVHTLKPGSSKRLKCKSIYKAYMPGRSGNSSGGMKSLLYYYDETCHPYIWVHDTGGDSSRMVKQQYISLEDLRDCSEIRIFRDHQRGCISVRKKPRPDFC